MKKVVFCGFGKLGKACVEDLIKNGYYVDYVLTHKELELESVDTFASDKGILYSYKDARKNLNEIKEIITLKNPDYLVSVNYRYIIPEEIFKIPKYALNIHGSLLPKYRGRTPHVWSIINGEDYSGITSHVIEKTVDTGDIIDQISIKIDDDDTGYSLLKKYEKLYPQLLINSLAKLEKNQPLIKQNDNEASYYGKRTPDMGYIDFRKDAKDVINFIRAQANPYPGAYYYLVDGRKIIINKVVVDESAKILPIGVICLIDKEYYVRCKDAVLKIIDYKID